MQDMNAALVIGSDTLSLITDQNDRNTAVLFGDGAGAIVVEATEGEPLILAHDLGLDGSLTPILYCDKGGYIFMEGREVFRKAVRATVESAERVLKQADVTAEEIALFIPHQANIRIIDAMGQRLGIDPARYAMCLDHTGNTSAAVLWDRPCRGRRCRAPQGRRPHLVLRLRSRHDLGERRRAMGWGADGTDDCPRAWSTWVSTSRRTTVANEGATGKVAARGG